MSDSVGAKTTQVPYRVQPPSAQQVAAALAALSLAGPMALGGMPVIPVTISDEQRRQQEGVVQQSESNVGVYQSSSEAEVGLAVSQQRLARVTREVDNITTHDVEERDIIHAANRVFAGHVDAELSGRFRSAFNHVVNDTVDLYILRDNEEWNSRNRP